VPTFTVSTVVPASPAAVWARIVTPEGVNGELMPIVRMRFPKAVRSLAPADVPADGRLGRCWLFLFGVVPFDYDDVRLERVDEGVGFHERSTMLSQRAWEHERTLAPEGLGTRVTDRVAFVPRVPGAGVLLAPVFAAVFRHRHRRLARWARGTT